MKVFLKKIGIVLSVFIALALSISCLSLYFMRQSSFYKPSFLVNEIDNNEFDYVIIGASTGLTTLNTKVIDSVLSTKGLNLSMDDTALSGQFLMLQHFLAQGKSTKYCILAPSIYSYDSQNNKLGDNDYRFLPYIGKPYVLDYFKQYSGTSATVISNSNWFPMSGVSYFNTEMFYPSVLTMVNPKKRNRFDDMGNYTYPNKNYNNQAITEFEPLSIFFKNDYLKKIKQLCMLNNIELICYLSPIKGKNVLTDTEQYNIINHSNILKNTIYFFDDIHVNSSGRQLVSTYFAKALKAKMK